MYLAIYTGKDGTQSENKGTINKGECNTRGKALKIKQVSQDEAGRKVRLLSPIS